MMKCQGPKSFQQRKFEDVVLKLSHGNNNKIRLNSIRRYSSLKQKITWRKGLLQLVGLLRIKHAECVEVLRAPNLELDNIFAPLDFHGAGILPSCGKKEILDLVDLLRLFADKTNNDQSKALRESYSLNI